ncbi:MAG TPA: DUF222 domain-containing protein [Gammaproteobacteria bacterium]|nr:DUF222 domain-containing protein [Gammaproteobacteria bacterium]
MDGASPAPFVGLYPWPVSPEEQALLALEKELFELWGHISAATYHFLELVAEFDRREGWSRHGVASCAQWLSWQCGIDSVTAREKVRVARALEKLPKISDSFRRGVVSYSKVRAMTRVATPDNEATLLMVAEHGTAAHIEKLVRKFCYVERLENAQRANGQHFDRYLHFSYDESGSLILHARLPAEVGAVVRKAIEAAVDVVEEKPRVPGASAEAQEKELHTVSDGWGAKRADALRLLADSFLARQTDDTGTAADRYQVVVHIDQRLLAAGAVTQAAGNAAEGGAPTRAPLRCELEDAHTLAVETARRLSCNCSLVGIVEDDEGEPLNVGRKTRAISPAMQRALKSRDGGCRFPGCDRTRFTQAHHVQHWGNGGETKLSNLVTLCTFHHRLVHEGGFGLRVTDDGVFVFTRPDGTRVEPNGRLGVRFRGSASVPYHVDRLFEHNLGRGIEIDEETARCRWLGERMDYGLAVENLCGWRDRAGEDGRIINTA